jgi:hypothetical protein
MILNLKSEYTVSTFNRRSGFLSEMPFHLRSSRAVGADEGDDGQDLFLSATSRARE